MNAQFLKTENGEELVVLKRREYDSLLARLGDEEAEDRMTRRIIDEVGERLASGEEALIPFDRLHLYRSGGDAGK